MKKHQNIKRIYYRNPSNGRFIAAPVRVARFTYNSPSSGRSRRFIQIINNNRVHLTGHDLNDNRAIKCFRKDKITGRVHYTKRNLSTI